VGRSHAWCGNSVDLSKHDIARSVASTPGHPYVGRISRNAAEFRGVYRARAACIQEQRTDMNGVEVSMRMNDAKLIGGCEAGCGWLEQIAAHGTELESGSLSRSVSEVTHNCVSINI